MSRRRTHVRHRVRREGASNDRQPCSPIPFLSTRFRVGTSDLTDVAAMKAREQITAFLDDTMLEHR
jgi:hypothetical protein